MLSCVEGGINTDPYSNIVHKKGSLVVSVPACGISNPGSNFTKVSIFFYSRYRVVWRGGIKYLETFQYIGALLCGGEGD